MQDILYQTSGEWRLYCSLIMHGIAGQGLPWGSCSVNIQEKGIFSDEYIFTALDKIFGQTLSFMWNGALRENFFFYFLVVFGSIGKVFGLAVRLGTRLSFRRVLRFSWYFLISQVVRQLLRHFVYIVFITNYRVSFYLWWKENLVKHQKVSKYYDQDCK